MWNRSPKATDRREELRQIGSVLKTEHVVIGKIARLFHLKGHDDSDHGRCRRRPADRRTSVSCWSATVYFANRFSKESIRLVCMSTSFLPALVPPTEVPSLIGAMDALVHTSFREGLARALPQALDCRSTGGQLRRGRRT